MPTTVLMSPGPRISNPFITQLVDNLGSDITVAEFSWRAALSTRYDVLHVHWPDALLNAPTPSRRLFKVLEVAALLALNKARGVKHVWTVHNVAPHEVMNWLQRRMLAAWSKSCDSLVYLSQAAIGDSADGRATVIKHGDYVPSMGEYFDLDVSPVQGRVLAFGLMRQYKGIETLIQALTSPETSNLSGRIVGRAVPEQYGSSLVTLAGATDRVGLKLEKVTDSQLAEEILAAEAVVLPYGKIYNSGAAILALTLGRPIIVTPSPTMLELRAEVGPAWVHCLPGELTAESLALAMADLRSHARPTRPTFVQRSWADIGEQYSALYRAR